MCIRDSRQAQGDKVPQLVAVFKVEHEDPVQRHLADRAQLGAREVLAQQHAEHRRRGGVFIAARGQLDARGL